MKFAGQNRMEIHILNIYHLQEPFVQAILSLSNYKVLAKVMAVSKAKLVYANSHFI